MKRRVLKLLLVVALLCCVIPVVASAECSHSSTMFPQTNNDGTHNVYCFSCGNYVDLPCDYETVPHSYNSSAKHYEKCSICGHTKNEADHNLTVKGEDGKNTHTMNCETCGYSSYYPESCNSYFGEYVKGETQHWRVCSKCSTKGTMTDHSGSIKDNNDGTHTINCTTCGKSVTVGCTYSGWQRYNANQHYRECSSCGHYEYANHSLIVKGQDGNNTHTMNCETCGYSSYLPENCNSYFGEYQQGETQHWQVCSKCNTKGTISNHSGSVSSNNNGTHKIHCSTCGKDTTVTCDWGDWQSSISGSTQHYRQCKNIYCRYTEYADHELTTVGVDGNESHSVKCGVCNYSKNENCTYLSGNDAYIEGETQHWKVCTKCHTKGKMTDHIGKAVSDDSGNHTVTCDICGKVATTECDLGDWQYPSSYEPDKGHYKACNVCTYKTAPEAHADFKYVASSLGGTHTKKCGICGKTVNSGEACTYVGYDPKSLDDASYHYQTCKFCEKTVKNTHSFNQELKCVCGAEKHVHHWVLSASGDTITVACDCETGVCEYNKDGGSLKISVEGLIDGKVEYDGEEKKATVTNSINTGSYSDSSYSLFYYKETNGGYNNFPVTAPTNAGKYKAEVYSALDSSVKASVEFEIEPTELIVSAADYEGTYDGEYHSITLNVPEGKGLTVKYSEVGEYYNQYPIPKFKDAGEYTVYYQVTDNSGNYSIKNGEGSAKVKINKANLATLISATDYSGRYDGNAHGITMNIPTNVSVMYSENGTDFNKYSNPTYRNVGEYTVYYKATVTGSDAVNYETSEATGSAKVTITKLNLAEVLNVTAEDTVFTYNRYDHELTPSYIPHAIKLEVKDSNGNSVSYVPGVSYYNNQITVKYSKDGGTTWSSMNPAFTDAGEYTVQYRIYVDGEEDNITGITGDKKVTINKAKLPFDSLRGYSGHYDGTYHYTFGYEVDDENQWGYTYWPIYLLDELTYNFSWTDDDGNAKTSEVTGSNYFLNWYEGKIPGFKNQNVGGSDTTGKTVSVTISGDNYETNTFTYEVRIGAGFAVADDYVGTYDGETHYITNYCPYGSKAEYKVNGNSTWLPAYQEPGRKDVGKTMVDWRMSFDSDGDDKIGGYDSNGQTADGGIYNTFGSKEIITSEGKNYVQINAAALTITAKSAEINADEEPKPEGYGYDVAGFKGSDTADLLEGQAVYTYTKDSDGNYTIAISGLKLPDGNNNYTITFVNGKLTVVDTTPPVISGIEDGKNYCQETKFTVTDHNLDKVTMDGEELTPNEDGSYTLPSDNAEHTIVATDKFGNTTTVTVTTMKIYSVTSECVEGVKFTGEAMVMHGNTYNFTVEIQTGYRKTSDFAVTVTGEYGELTGDYNVTAIVSNLHIKVTGVEKIPYHDVTASHDEGCKVLGEATVKDGDTYRFQVNIEDGYKKGDNFKVTVNGEEVKPNLLGQYVVENVHEDLVIKVTGVVKKAAAADKKEEPTATPTGTTRKQGPTQTPYTGDTFNLTFWATVMASSFVLAVAAFAVLIKVMRNKGRYSK